LRSGGYACGGPNRDYTRKMVMQCAALISGVRCPMIVLALPVMRMVLMWMRNPAGFLQISSNILLACKCVLKMDGGQR